MTSEKTLQKTIEGLGYSKRETKVYLATLSLGECTVSEVAAKARMPRSSAQIILEKLHQEGIVNFYVRKRYKYWQAEPPKKILQILQEKQTAFESVIKDLAELRNGNHERPVIKVFSGKDELRLINRSILEERHHVSAMVPWDAWIALMGREYTANFTTLRVKHFLKMRLLIPAHTGDTKFRNEDEKEMRHTKILPEKSNIENAIFIFGSSVAIISLNPVRPIAVVIEDPATARTMSVFFEDLWHKSSE